MVLRPTTKPHRSDPLQPIDEWIASMFDLAEPPDDERFRYESLAFNYRQSLQRMMEDHGVRDAVRQALAQATSQEEASILIIEEMLLASCWISRATISVFAKSQEISRSDTKKDLDAAQKKCLSLVDQLTQLKPVLRDALTLEYLEGRIKSGDPDANLLALKTWRSMAQWESKPSVIDALEVLAKHLTEEIEWINQKINTRRQGNSRQSRNHMLMDELMRLSTGLGRSDKAGNIAPDIGLVFSIMSHLDPATSLDQSTIQKRWTIRQRKVSQKTS